MSPRPYLLPGLVLLAILFLPLGAIPSGAGEATVSGIAGGVGAFDEFDCVRPLPAAKDLPARFVMGDANGLLHVYEARAGRYAEVWVSGYLEGAVAAIEVTDVNEDGLAEIVVFTDRGRIHYLDSQGYTTLWSSVPGEYERLTAATAANVDDDPQPELIMCAGGRLILFDAKDQFEEWRSEQTTFTTTDILVADVDGDDKQEIVLSDGYVFDAHFRALEWQSPEAFGERLGAIDLDDDGILELIGEFNGRFLKVFDVDLRRAKSLKR